MLYLILIFAFLPHAVNCMKIFLDGEFLRIGSRCWTPRNLGGNTTDVDYIRA